jgi:hypothetical protein
MLLYVSGHEISSANDENKLGRQVSNLVTHTFKTYVTEAKYFKLQSHFLTSFSTY